MEVCGEGGVCSATGSVSWGGFWAERRALAGWVVLGAIYFCFWRWKETRVKTLD